MGRAVLANLACIDALWTRRIGPVSSVRRVKHLWVVLEGSESRHVVIFVQQDLQKLGLVQTEKGSVNLEQAVEV